MDQIITLAENPFILVMILVAVIFLTLALVHMILKSGREIKIRDYIIIPARRDSDFPIVDELPYSFQREMVADLKDSYKRRIKDICNLQYVESMNWENDFLQRVSALYKGADKVYAITLSSISDFWISESDRQLILKYLKCQQGIEIHRLFVFESPYDLMRYEDVLRANYHAYGTIGGVYITSSQNYQVNILNNICDNDSIYRFLDKDFGVWESDVSILATLQGTQLSFNKIDEEKLEDIDISAMKAIFSSEIKGVFKWDVSSKAENIAKKIFSDDVTYVGPVTHLVFMTHENEKILDDIATKIIELDQIQREAIEQGVSINFNQEDPWWGINIQSIGSVSPFTDGKYVGQLRCDDKYKYILIIQLPSIDDLREWYRYESHSDIREAVYTKLVDKVEEIYSQIKEGGCDVALGFQDIEEKVWESERLRRMDFIFNKKLSDIPAFPIYEQYINNV